jgi:hypothetical protein
LVQVVQAVQILELFRAVMAVIRLFTGKRHLAAVAAVQQVLT